MPASEGRARERRLWALAFAILGAAAFIAIGVMFVTLFNRTEGIDPKTQREITEILDTAERNGIDIKKLFDEMGEVRDEVDDLPSSDVEEPETTPSTMTPSSSVQGFRMQTTTTSAPAPTTTTTTTTAPPPEETQPAPEVEPDDEPVLCLVLPLLCEIGVLSSHELGWSR